jgi:polyisoprenoid-binding protein YceI
VARYLIAPERSHVWIDARSNVHPIHSSTDGLEGFVEIALGPEGAVDLSVPPTGQLSLRVSRLTSGNRLEDRELHKRIDARRYPTIDGLLDRVEQNGHQGTYKVGGDITFRGVSRHYEDMMTIRSIDEETIQLGGASPFDIRDFGMEPPRVLILKVEPEVVVRIEIVAVKEA